MPGSIFYVTAVAVLENLSSGSGLSESRLLGGMLRGPSVGASGVHIQRSSLCGYMVLGWLTCVVKRGMGGGGRGSANKARLSRGLLPMIIAGVICRCWAVGDFVISAEGKCQQDGSDVFSWACTKDAAHPLDYVSRARPVHHLAASVSRYRDRSITQVAAVLRPPVDAACSFPSQGWRRTTV